MFLDNIKKQLEELGHFKIVFLGDSITSAEWVHPNWREVVEYVLKEETQKKFENWKIPSWGIRCINSGFDGSTTKDWLARVEDDVLKYSPDLVICMGTDNDKHFEITPEQQKQNILKLLDILLKQVRNVVYCTNIPSNSVEYSASYVPYYQSVKNLFPYNNVSFIDMLEEFKSYDMNLFFTLTGSGNKAAGLEPGDIDYIHPNQLGNVYIAKIILERVFGLSFDPEKYIKTASEGFMFPQY